MDELQNIIDKTNNTDTNKVTIFESLKKKFNVWSILVVVIASRKSIKNS